MSVLISVVSVLGQVADKALGGYIGFFAEIIERLSGVPLKKFLEPPPPALDERLAKLEVARTALADSLRAIEELQREAEKGKQEYARVSAQLAEAIQNKDEAQHKLEVIRTMMTQDVSAFQALAGVPNVNRERFIGFASGVFASILASAIVSAAVYFWKKAAS